MFRNHKMTTELIEISRKASKVQVDSNQAASRLFQVASRLENCPRPESKRLAACPQAASRLVTGWAYWFLLLSFLRYFSTLVLPLSQP